jgi:hypothetical protein
MSRKQNYGGFMQASIEELRTFIPEVGHRLTPIIQSEAGCGKTSILKMLKEDLGEDEYDYIYVDCPVKDYSDICMTIPNHDTKALESYVGALFKLDSPKRKVILLDEFMKAPQMLKIIFTRLMLEREVGDIALPEGSIVFGTSNNQSDGLGDAMLAHAGNRVCIVQMKKPDAEEWLYWANANGVHPYVQTFVHEYQDCLASYLDGGQKDNPYIFNPQNPQLSFVSPRSLEKCSIIVEKRDILGENMTMVALAGTIGASAAAQFSAMLQLGDRLPKFEDVLKRPMDIDIPDEVSAQLILMFQSTNKIKTQEDCTNFMKFVQRIPQLETQAVFFGMALKNEKTKMIACKNKTITDWATTNHFIY